MHWGGKAPSSASESTTEATTEAATGQQVGGSQLTVTIANLKGTVRGKVMLEAVNPIRDQLCKSVGCGPGGGNGKTSGWAWLKSKVQRTSCSVMDCDDVDIGAVLVGSVVVDLTRGLDVAANVTFDSPAEGTMYHSYPP